MNRRTAAPRVGTLIVGITALAHAAFAGPSEPAGPPAPAGLRATKIWSCQTQSVAVAPAAATTKGTFRVQTVEGDTADGTRWMIVDVDAQHSASFAATQSACRAECEATPDPTVPSALNLWAPKRLAPSSLPAGAALTIAVLDTTTGKLRASTIIDNAIAALEHGSCVPVVP